LKYALLKLSEPESLTIAYPIEQSESIDSSGRVVGVLEDTGAQIASYIHTLVTKAMTQQKTSFATIPFN